MTDSIYQTLRDELPAWAEELGFARIGVTDVDLGEHEAHLARWLDRDFHGDMAYMARHGTKRSRPRELVEGTVRVLSLRMNYLMPDTRPKEQLASDGAYVSRYALGRDYHKVIRQRLVKLWQRMQAFLLEHGIDHHQARGFTDSAPLLEKALAEKAGLGWIGKNTLLLTPDAGSLFFLAEMLTDIPLPIDKPKVINRCGSCTSCMDVCPTDAIVAPYQLDARRCISYLTIEQRGSIPVEFRAAIGNRIFGCDDCQLFCPWNKFASTTDIEDFSPRHGLDQADLLDLYQWTREEFELRTQGSAIRRTGYEGWRRNIAVALGNGKPDSAVVDALQSSLTDASDLLAEHVHWALAQLRDRLASGA